MTPDARIKWHQLGLVPTTGMAFWNMYEAGVSGHGVVADYSGNTRTISSGTTDPVLTSDVVYGQPAWYFDGTATDPLLWSGSLTLKHYFVLAAHEDATFNLNRGLMSGPTTGDILASNNSGTTFFDLSFAGFEYRKSDVVYTQVNQQAPMSGGFELIEVVVSGGASTDGVQVGRQRDIAGRIWKGYWADHMGFTSVLSTADRRKVLLYYSLRYGVHIDTAVPLYFPSSDLVGTAVRNRFYPAPRAWARVTEDYEFEDSNKTFNEFAGDPPHRWEYKFVNVSKTQATLFDVFNDTARTANTFYFKDPEGYVWSNVRIAEYDRNHREHKRWIHEVNFDLVGYNSTATYEG